MNEERMSDVTEAVFQLMRRRGTEMWGPMSLPEVVAYGIEVALAWKPESQEEEER